MINTNSTFYERLSALYDAKYNIKNFTDTTTNPGWYNRAALDMFAKPKDKNKKPVLQYSDMRDTPEGITARKKEVYKIGTTLRGHIKGTKKEPPKESVADLSGRWLDIYCRFFGCSAAYLFGEINGFTPEDTDIQAATGLAPEAIKTLRNYRLSGAFEGSRNTTADIVSFLLRPEHCKRNSGGLLHLIGAYLTGDFSVSGFDEYIHTDGSNGSGFELLTSDVIRAAMPNMILQRLQEYRNEIQ